jgi:hypothetical protein
MTEAVQTPIEELLRMSSKAEGWKTYSERGEGVLLESRHHNDLHDLAASEIESLRARVSHLSDMCELMQARADAAEKLLRKLADAADNVLMDVWGSNDGLRTEVVAAFNLLDDTRKARAAGGETE